MDLGLSGRTAVVVCEDGETGPACATLLAGEGASVHLVVGEHSGVSDRGLAACGCCAAACRRPATR